MIVDILIVLPFVVVFLVYRAITPRVAHAPSAALTAAPAPAPEVKDPRPLWAQVPMVEVVPPRCTAWENEWASKDARLGREAEAGKDRPLPRFVPSPELPHQRKFHRPLKAKSRNWA